MTTVKAKSKTPTKCQPSQTNAINDADITPSITPAPNAVTETNKTNNSVQQTVLDSASRLQIQNYLHTASGQLKILTIQELEHDYAKPCHIHPDPTIRAHAANFLFMKNFPRHLTKLRCQTVDEDVDIMTYEEQKKIPFLTPRPSAVPISVDEDIPELDSSITDSWTCEMNKLWTRATKIVYSDRIARLSFEGNVNEILLKRNLQDQTANKFRELFASTFWNMDLVTWLHKTLLEHLNPNYLSVYMDSLQILKHKIPSLIDSFYVSKTENKVKPFLNDPLFNTLSHYKLKKLPRKPIFIIVPSGLNQSSVQSSRLKYWNSMLNSMGKLVTITVQAKQSDYISDILSEIRCLVNEKIRNCKNLFENRPIILVGFNYGSLIAAHCALQNPKSVCATICLGFPLKGINGIRGELGDPLLELTVPIQFIIGENAVMTSLDDIEDFRERMTKTETALVVVGGADDKLIISNVKKRLECLTQSMVDRCVADEIFVFLSVVLLNYNEDSNSNDLKSLKSSGELAKNLLGDSSQTPMNKKKTNRKRISTPTENGMTPSNSFINTLKPPSKKKRPPSKTSKPNLDPSKPVEPLNIDAPNSTLMSSFPQIFPNLTTVLNNSSAEKGTFDFRKTNIGSIKVDKSRGVISDQGILFPLQSPTPKKVPKKSLGSSAINISLNSTLSPINEEKSPSKSMGLIQINESTLLNLSSSFKSSRESSPVKASTSSPTKIQPSFMPTNSSPISNISLTSKDANSVSDNSLHQSSTRTGRQIKPPKSLDF